MDEVRISNQFIQSKADPCLYSKVIKGEAIYILIYVDDLLVASKNKKLIENVYILFILLNEKFEIKNLVQFLIL